MRWYDSSDLKTEPPYSLRQLPEKNLVFSARSSHAAGFNMNRVFPLTLALVVLVSGLNALRAGDAPPSGTPQERADALLKQFTLQEKLEYIGGVNGFSIRAMPRLNLPEIHMADGPMGVRGNNETKPSTSYPAGVGLAATWDPALARKIGDSMGRDCRARGFNILLGPGVNISRSPLCGRNFEYMGEDPFLAGQTAAAFIQGLQGEGVLGCVKHFAANNQEWDRNRISSEVDERTMREIYLPAFEAAVKQGHVGSIMTAYNLVNGFHCTQNDWLQNQVLKKDWGFTGFDMSDWGAAHDGKACALYGLDLEMPNGANMNPKNLLELVQNGTIPESVIDDKVRRILVTIIGAGFLDRPQLKSDIPLNDPQSDAVALEVAHSSIVLLKNEGNVLPLQLDKPQTILVVGPNAEPAVPGGAGSGHVQTFRAVGVFDGIKAAAPQATVLLHPGLQNVVGSSNTFTGADVLADEANKADVIIASVGFGQAADTNSAHLPYNAGWPSGEARQLGLVEGEASDRTFSLPAAQVETLKLLGHYHKKLIVVMNAGAAIDTTGWLDQTPVFMCAWYPGQEGGKALADLITGAANPCGKLPVTFAKQYQDYPSAPYYAIRDNGKTPYTEGVNVGYRGFDANKVEPLFCFGHGLSYTTFAYSDLKVAPVDANTVQVSFSIKNTGSRAGAEVAEVYVTPASGSVPRPPKELKGYAKVELAPGETKPVTVTLDSRAFAYWNTQTHDWTVDPGQYGILIGASSRDIRLTGQVTR